MFCMISWFSFCLSLESRTVVLETGSKTPLQNDMLQYWFWTFNKYVNHLEWEWMFADFVTNFSSKLSVFRNQQISKIWNNFPFLPYCLSSNKLHQNEWRFWQSNLALDSFSSLLWKTQFSLKKTSICYNYCLKSRKWMLHYWMTIIELILQIEIER